MPETITRLDHGWIMAGTWLAGIYARCGLERFGGARRDRTDDLLLAKQALSQLSYGPYICTGFVHLGSGDAPEQAVLSANVRRWSTLFYRY